MTLTDNEIEELRTLEESLWIDSTRFNQEYMDRVLHEDFFEFGRSGKVYSRQRILNIPAGKIDAKIPFDNFRVTELDKNCIMVTYISEEHYAGYSKANRCSIWLKTESGWKLRFHQGTPINE